MSENLIYIIFRGAVVVITLHITIANFKKYFDGWGLSWMSGPSRMLPAYIKPATSNEKTILLISAILTGVMTLVFIVELCNEIFK